MKTDDLLGIIELGDENLKCLILKIGDNNNPEILSAINSPSEGIRNDVIINLAKATNSVRSCISSAEKKAKISLKKINVILEQPDFLCTTFSLQKKIHGSTIQKDDIEFLLKEAKKKIIQNDRKQSIIHIFNHNYIVDGKTFVDEPIDVHANLLTHEVTFITAPKNNLKNINQVFVDCDIEIEKLFSRTFLIGAEFFDNEELKFGSVAIDLGFEKISMGLFKNLALVHSITLPFGIHHIDKDISKVCSLTLEESKVIKNDIDYSFQENQKIFDDKGYLKNNYFINSKYRKISKNLIISVLKSRLDEIFNILKKQLIIPGFNFTSGINFLLTGMGSNLFKLDKYCEEIFKSNVKIVNLDNLDADTNFKNSFSICLSAFKIIRDGWETEAIPETGKKNIEKIGFFAKIFGIR